MKKLYIVIPCYNEEKILQKTVAETVSLLDKLANNGKIHKNSKILFVDDGSTDNTWTIIRNACKENRYAEGLKLSKNVGHQNALLAGLDAVGKICDAAITVDADLQDDITVIETMVDKYLNGAEMVLGVRRDRKSDSFFKRFTAQSFYKIMSFLGAKTVYNHADFRLMSKTALAALSEYEERNVFLRGIITCIGYRTELVYYARKEREAGESKYNLKKMISFAWDGITSFSTKPISAVFGIGAAVMMMSVLALVFAAVLGGKSSFKSGALSILLSVWFIGGLQIFSIGLVGQYVGKIYTESKHRPRYHVEEFLTNEFFADKNSKSEAADEKTPIFPQSAALNESASEQPLLKDCVL